MRPEAIFIFPTSCKNKGQDWLRCVRTVLVGIEDWIQQMIINYYIARTRKGWRWAWLWRWDLFVAFATAFVFIIPTCFLFLFFFCVFVSSCCPHLIFPRPKKRNHFISRCFHYSTEIHILGSDLHLCSFVFFLLWILKRPCSVGMLDSVCAKLFPGLPYYTHISVSLKGLGKKKRKKLFKRRLHKFVQVGNDVFH